MCVDGSVRDANMHRIPHMSTHLLVQALLHMSGADLCEFIQLFDIGCLVCNGMELSKSQSV